MARRHHRSARRNKKNIVNKTLDQTVSIAKSSSKKYMPKVKTGEQSIPFLQRMTRKFFGIFTGKSKTKKHRRH